METRCVRTPGFSASADMRRNNQITGEHHVSLIVQKFGGTSVADAGKIKAAAQKAVAAKRAGHQVVMVLSARGNKTDELIALAAEITETPPPREMDMLLATGEQESVALMAMAIGELGETAVSLTGTQIEIGRASCRERV